MASNKNGFFSVKYILCCRIFNKIHDKCLLRKTSGFKGLYFNLLSSKIKMQVNEGHRTNKLISTKILIYSSWELMNICFSSMWSFRLCLKWQLTQFLHCFRSSFGWYRAMFNCICASWNSVRFFCFVFA